MGSVFSESRQVVALPLFAAGMLIGGDMSPPGFVSDDEMMVHGYPALRDGSLVGLTGSSQGGVSPCYVTLTAKVNSEPKPALAVAFADSELSKASAIEAGAIRFNAGDLLAVATWVVEGESFPGGVITAVLYVQYDA